MSNTMFYGEMAAKISAHLHQNPDHLIRISHVIENDHDTDETIWRLCADAARVFDTVEDLSGEHFIDWHKALDRYSGEVLDHLLMGQKPNMVDMLCMASRSIQNTR